MSENPAVIIVLAFGVIFAIFKISQILRNSVTAGQVEKALKGLLWIGGICFLGLILYQHGGSSSSNEVKPAPAQQTARTQNMTVIPQGLTVVELDQNWQMFRIPKNRRGTFLFQIPYSSE